MTRSEVLRNLLKTIFGNYTISEADGFIIAGVSLYQNCNYSPTSYDNFKKLFEVALLKPNPQYTDSRPFDRTQALSNTQKYLNARGIIIPTYLNIEDKSKLIFKTLVERILRAIVIDEQGKKKDASKGDNINKIFYKAINEALNDVRCYNTMSYFSCLTDPTYPEMIDTNYKNEPDKCNFSALIGCSAIESYKVLQMLRNISVTIPMKSEDEPFCVGDDFSQLSHDLTCGKYSDKIGNYERFPLFYFPDEDMLFSSIKWKTYVNEKDIISTSKASGLSYTINDFRFDDSKSICTVTVNTLNKTISFANESGDFPTLYIILMAMSVNKYWLQIVDSFERPADMSQYFLLTHWISFEVSDFYLCHEVEDGLPVGGGDDAAYLSHHRVYR